MAWTRLRSRWRDLLAPCVADRVDVHAAGYRLEHARRVWLTVDGNEVLSCCGLAFQQKFRAEYEQLGFPRGHGLSRLPSNQRRAIGERVGDAVDPNVRSNTDFLAAMVSCISSPADRLLASEDALVRALAMLDRRVGSRRLARIAVETEHRWVQQLHALRCSTTPLR